MRLWRLAGNVPSGTGIIAPHHRRFVGARREPRLQQTYLTRIVRADGSQESKAYANICWASPKMAHHGVSSATANMIASCSGTACGSTPLIRAM